MAKPLSWNEIRKNLDEFALEWAGESREHAEYASFWDQLLACYGVQRRRVATFQQQAERASTKNIGFVDFFWPKVAIGEHKSLGKMGAEGEVAEQQAFDYLAGGSIAAEDFPRYVISTDYAHMRVTDLEAEGGPASTYFPLSEIRQHAEELGFLGGYQAVSIDTAAQEAASIEAAKVMADLYAALTSDADDDYAFPVEDEADEDEEIHTTAILLTRLLFLMFGDDAGLWEKGLFERWLVERTSEDGSDLGSQLTLLFKVLDTPEQRRPARLDETMRRFPYVNGGIFDGAEDLGILAFDRTMRDALIRACRFNWAEISPAVFGSLFQAVKSKKARRLAGEHYTTETNILKTLGPLFLDDYRARVRAAWDSAKKLREIQAELATNAYCDPACGCGNFLVVAYRELRAIELSIITRLRELSGVTDSALDVTIGLAVSLDQFAGIEINWWPAKIAETAMFLVDHQANLEMAKALGHAPDRLPITISARITHGNALTTDWNAAIPQASGRTFVFGNPPFLGDNTRDEAQKAELQAAWGGDKTLSRLDYVTAWHATALKLYALPGRTGDWAFVTTNSITQGDQVPRLFGPIFDAGWRIKFGHRTFGWSSEAPGAAAVHCVIVGFTKTATGRPRLFEYPTPASDPQEIAVTQQINPYLIDGPMALVEKRSTLLSSQLNKTEYGSKPTDDGNLIVLPAALTEVRSDPRASKYLRPFLGGRELLHGEERWCLWLADADPQDLQQSAVLRRRVEAVRAFRGRSKATSTREYPHHHLFRQLAAQDQPYLAVPRVVSERRRYLPVLRLSPETIVSDLVFQLADPDGFQFAIISSSMFITWQKAIGGRLESRLRFASTLTWYTFPLPHVADEARARIIAAGEGVLAARELHPERSLAEHYSPLAMDPALVKAHDALDREVDKAFGARGMIRDEATRQRLLFESYLALTGQAARPGR
ncbi:hypothetical protein USB125703_00713 [Pseudoclavibacter triregionum]|nr:hypothetical protein USB125703_00713 [Pseudoclavibacter triregionum]